MMRKIKFYVIGLAILIIGFAGCQKGKLLNPTNQSDFQYDVKSKINYSGIETKSKGFKSSEGSDQILVFKDMDTFKSTLSELERQTKELDDAFVDFYKDLDEEAINEKEEEIGFNEKSPIIEFENKLGFNSCYQKIAKEEEQWLKQDDLDLENSPDNYFIISETLRSLLNIDNEVQIGKTIYKITENGYFEIGNGNLKSLLVIEKIAKDLKYLPNNVKFIGDMYPQFKSGGCSSGKTSSSYKVSGKKRIKWVVAHKTYPWNRYVIAKTKNYKKSWRGWKKYRTYCKAQVYGYIAGTDENGVNCSIELNFNPNNYYESETNKKTVKHKINVATKTQSGWVKSYHYGAGGILYTHTLTW